MTMTNPPRRVSVNILILDGDYYDLETKHGFDLDDWLEKWKDDIKIIREDVPNNDISVDMEVTCSVEASRELPDRVKASR